MATVSPIPKDYPTVTPVLVVRNIAEALEFYKRIFGAKEAIRMPGPNGRMMHAEITIGNSHIMLGQETPEMNQLSPQSLHGTPVNLRVYVEDVDRTFNEAVKAGATMTLPVMDAFFGDRQGALKDPFGHSWGIATRKRNLSAEQIKKGAEEYYAKTGRSPNSNA